MENFTEIQVKQVKLGFILAIGVPDCFISHLCWTLPAVRVISDCGFTALDEPTPGCRMEQKREEVEVGERGEDRESGRVRGRIW